MPATARLARSCRPLRPLEAIAQSAKLLRDLRREFGNLGLAAAAYNAGPGRVRDWLAGRRGLPRETGAYVRLVTGQSAEQWTGVKAATAEMHVANTVPCRQIAGLFARPAGGRNEARRSVGRGIGRKLIRCDGARRVSPIAGEVRLHPGGPGATHRSPWARARQHGLGAGPRRGGEPHECRKIVREPARRRRELPGATFLKQGTVFGLAGERSTH